MCGSGISWAICKSAPRTRQITTPAPNHSVFYRPDALPADQPTASKHWRQFSQQYWQWMLYRCCHLANISGSIQIIPTLHDRLGDVSKIARSLGGSGPPPNTWFLGSTQVHAANSTSTGSSVSVQLIVMSNTETHTHRPQTTLVTTGHTFLV